MNRRALGGNGHIAMHPDLLAAQKLVYESCRLTCTNLMQEAESAEYGACTFEINNHPIKFRTAKITPTKIGQFVTLWKRIGNGPIQPHDITDKVELFVISVRNAKFFGQFVFPKNVLHEKGIIAKAGKGGKRAMRVYPPWDKTQSPQAKKTQAWQVQYFFAIDADKGVDKERVRGLFGGVSRRS